MSTSVEPPRRTPREHDGRVIAIRSNVRWCSDALEFTCWNGEIVRIAFALDCHDRETIGWLATTAGVSGECPSSERIGQGVHFRKGVSAPSVVKVTPRAVDAASGDG
jgi:transposase InsO family protein